MPKHHAKKSDGPTQRMLRVGELIRHKLAEMLTRGDIHDDELARTVVTVPEVRMSPDLKVATAFIMPLGGERIEAVINALNANKKFIRGEVAHEVNLKYAPDLRFLPDETFEEADKITRLLNEKRLSE